jgi:hypothetical protein
MLNCCAFAVIAGSAVQPSVPQHPIRCSGIHSAQRDWPGSAWQLTLYIAFFIKPVPTTAFVAGSAVQPSVPQHPIWRAGLHSAQRDWPGGAGSWRAVPSSAEHLCPLLFFKVAFAGSVC